MPTVEIYKLALQSLRELGCRQHQLWSRYLYTPKGPEWKAKFFETKRKITWLERLIEHWEGQ